MPDTPPPHPYDSDHLKLFVLAIGVGALAAYASILFRLAFGAMQFIYFGHVSDPNYGELPSWVILVVLGVGGLLVGLINRFVLPGGKPIGMVDAMEAQLVRDSRIALREGLGAALAAATSIGVGASVGRYGPVVHLGASIGSLIAQRLRLHRGHTEILLGCGIAAAIAASFNAPIAGVIFVHEAIIGHYALKAFAPTTIASVMGAVIMHIHYGDEHLFIAPPSVIHSPTEYPLFALMGVAGALVAVAFIRAILTTGDLADRLPLPDWALPIVGGLLLGAFGLALPEVLGLGEAIIRHTIAEPDPAGVLLLLMAGKIAATALSFAFRFSGGIFGPALFIGAMLGGAVAGLAPQVTPIDIGTYVLVGIGAVISPVIGAPITTILIVFEMTDSYAVTSAVMTAVVVANVVSSQIFGRSAFTYALERRGLDLSKGRETRILESRSVADVMNERFLAVPTDTPLSACQAILSDAPDRDLFVVDSIGHLLGRVTLFDALTAFANEPYLEITAGEVARSSEQTLMLAAGTDLVSALH